MLLNCLFSFILLFSDVIYLTVHFDFHKLNNVNKTFITLPVYINSI